MATTKISTGVLKDGSVTSAKLDTNISIVGDLTVDTNTLFVDSASGNVGIGTTSPRSLLDLDNGTSAGVLATFDYGGTGGWNQYRYNGGTIGYIGQGYGLLTPAGSTSDFVIRSQDELVFATGSTERMRISSTGNVGIGTSSPDAQLDVNNGQAYTTPTIKATKGIQTGGGDSNLPTIIGYPYLAIGEKEWLASAVYSIGFGWHDATKQPVQLGMITTSTSSNTIGDFFVATRTLAADADPTVKMTVTASGNVGIGTSSPSAKLQVKSSNATTEDVAYFGNVSIADGLAITTNGNLDWGFNVRNTRNLTFATNQTERMRIDSAGNVGIGTTPSSWGSGFLGLDLGGSTAANIGGISRTRLSTNLYYDGTNNRYKTGLGSLGYFQDATNISHVWYTAPTGTAGGVATITERMRIDSSGNVGIGTSSPNVALQIGNGLSSVTQAIDSTNGGSIVFRKSGVNSAFVGEVAQGLGTGDGLLLYTYSGADRPIRFYPNAAERMRLTSTGDLHVDGDVIAYSTTISDERLKDDIQTIDNALDKVCNLRGVSYTWNNGSRKGQNDLGLIAQEVEQVLPELVREKEMPMIDGGTYKTVDYEKIVGVLIEAIKELKAEVESLKNK